MRTEIRENNGRVFLREFQEAKMILENPFLSANSFLRSVLIFEYAAVSVS